jgi:type IV secretion system protein VirB11
VSAEVCLSACMRLSPDRISLAELRGSEAWEYVGGSNNGHPGSITTTHANGAVQVFDRVATLIPIGRGLEVSGIRRILHTTLDVLVFMADWKVREVFHAPIFAREKMS